MKAEALTHPHARSRSGQAEDICKEEVTRLAPEARIPLGLSWDSLLGQENRSFCSLLFGLLGCLEFETELLIHLDLTSKMSV